MNENNNIDINKNPIEEEVKTGIEINDMNINENTDLLNQEPNEIESSKLKIEKSIIIEPENFETEKINNQEETNKSVIINQNQNSKYFIKI